MKNGFRVKAYKHPRLKFVVRGKVAGKWQRKYFETKGEATTYAQKQNTLLLNEGRRGVEFPSWLRLSAERAYETLLPWGKTIEDAIHFYVSHLERTKKSAPLQTAVDELIKGRRLVARHGHPVKRSRRHRRQGIEDREGPCRPRYRRLPALAIRDARVQRKMQCWAA
jgi:hypothetical protein